MQKILLILTAIAVFGFYGCSEDESGPSKSFPSDWPAPAFLETTFPETGNLNNDIIADFNFVTQDGDTISFYELSAGKKTFVSFGRPSCGFCALQAPAMQKAHLEKENWLILEFYTSDSFTRTMEQEKKIVQDYMTKNGYSFLYIIPEPYRNYTAMMNIFPEFSGVPKNFILDENHKIIPKSGYGLRSEGDLVKVLDEVDAGNY